MSATPLALAGPARARRSSTVQLIGIEYLRASKDGSGRSISVGDQKEEGDEFFEENNIALYATYCDNNLSGSLYATEEREQYELALHDLKSGRANLLWAWDSSRAQRNLEVYGRLRRICIEAGAFFAYGGRIYDMADPTDRKITARDAAEAEAAADNISIHTTRGVKSRAKRGEHAGPLAFGYRPVYSQDTGKSLGWVIVEAESNIIRRIVDWLLDEVAPKTLKWIARRLNAEGVPCARDRRWDKRLVTKLVEQHRHDAEWAAFLESLTPEDREWAVKAVARVHDGESPKEVGRDLNRAGIPHFFASRWCGTKVKNIALSPPSAGLRRHRGEVMMRRVPDANAPNGVQLVPVETTWEGIKTPEEHAKLVALLTGPERLTREPDEERVKHLWSGIAMCGVCGDKTSRVFVKGKGRYRCYSNSCVLRPQDLTDAWLTEQALLLLEREDAAQIFRLDMDMSEGHQAQREAEGLRAMLDGFRSQALAKKITAESFAFFEAELLPQIEKAEEKSKRATLPPELAEVIGTDTRAAFLALALPKQRKILKAIMRPKIYQTKRKVRGWLDHTTIDPGFLYLLPDASDPAEQVAESAPGPELATAA